MSTYSEVGRKATPQTERADQRQVENSAGGFTFALDDEARLRRFLILGTEGGTYYAQARDLTIENVEVVERLARKDAPRTVDIIREVSIAGRAPKAQPALLALAIVASTADEAGRQAAFAVVPDVVRTGTHLFQFVTYLENFRGWGRGAKRAIANWYNDRTADDLAYQILKYRQREGWSHGDVLRLAHPKPKTPDHDGLYSWALGRPQAKTVPPIVTAFENAQHATPAEAMNLISGYGLSWEMLPDRLLGDRDVWGALLARSLPIGALIRQLPRLTNLGLTKGDTGKVITANLMSPELLRRGRIHPLNVLVALKTYESGRSARGVGTWTPERRVVDALDAAFYESFGNVEPTGKRTLLALDVSGSMTAAIAGMPISAREASAAMAMVTARVEDDWEAVGFTGDGGWSRSATALTPLSISPRQRMDDVLRTMSGLRFGTTDCALPMVWALKERRAFDTFVVYTDSETYAGSIHPHQALNEYRQKMGIDARLVVVGMTSTGFTIAYPHDVGMLDVVGFDTATPELIGNFARGL